MLGLVTGSGYLDLGIFTHGAQTFPLLFKWRTRRTSPSPASPFWRAIAPADLAQIKGIAVIQLLPQGVEIETPRYQAFSDLALFLAKRGAAFVEIAGNDQILYTDLFAEPTEPGALMDMARQGLGDYRHLHLIKVADQSRALLAGGVEHIHDY